MKKKFVKLLIIAAPLVIVAVLLGVELVDSQGNVGCFCINELMATSLGSADDVICDWIELYNGTDDCINLSGYGLSDEKNSPFKYIFPEIKLSPGEFLLIYAGEDNAYEENNYEYIYCEFGLSAQGGAVYLTDNKGNLVDFLEYGHQNCNISFGRTPYNYEKLVYFTNATPGEMNTMVFVDSTEKIVTQVTFSDSSGIYENELEVSLSAEDGIIVYSLDGSIPDETSLIYANPIKIEEKKYGEGTVVRARVYKAGKLGPVTTNTYFVHSEDTNPYVSRVVALTVDPDEMFGNSGIYMLGNTYTYFKMRGGNEYQANYMMDQNINGEIEIFADDNTIAEQFHAVVTTKIAGGMGRAFLQKSFIVSMDKHYSLKGIESTAIKLRPRGGAESVIYSKIDRFLEDVCMDLDLGCTEGEYADLYINGEYWGLYVIQEAIDESYWENHYGIKKGEICSSRGTSKDKKEYTDFAMELFYKDLSLEEDYQWLCNQIDVQNFTDYIIAEDLFCNNDWGVNSANCEAWKYKGDKLEKGYKDGKWRFRLFDLDKCFTSENVYSSWIEEQLSKNIICGEISGTDTLIFQKLMVRDEYKDLFYKRYRTLMQTTFAKERLLEKWDDLFTLLDAEMPLNLEKYWEGFYQTGGLREHYVTYEIWRNNMMELRENIECRWNYINEYLEDYQEQNR